MIRSAFLHVLSPFLRPPQVAVLVLGIVACSSGTSNGTSADVGSAESTSGSDCPALRDKQTAANCPKFDPAKYLVDCQKSEQAVSASCKTQFHAFATCMLGQPIGCNGNGAIDDTTPTACKSEDEALSTCAAAAGKK